MNPTPADLIPRKAEMAEGRELKTKAQAGVEIQESGEILFLFKPKVEKQEVHGPDDVQRFYIILRPESALKTPLQSSTSSHGQSSSSTGTHTQEVGIEKQALFRLIIMGRKRLPHPAHKSQPYWGFVQMVTTHMQDVKTALQAAEYDTSTRGHRHVSGARAVGEGIYGIVRHNSHPQKMKSNYHTHLIYKLEFPLGDETNIDAQKSFNIEREGSFLIQIKNPDQEGTASSSHYKYKRRAQFPAHLQGQFGHKRYHPADPPEYLNFEGCEFLLISASDDIEEELGLELKCETTEGEECDLVKIFGDIASTQPPLKQTWL